MSRIRHKVMKICLMAVILSFIPLFTETSTVGATDTVWVDQALNLQEDIDFDAPLSQTTWIGTHNSFNATNDGYFVDANQELSITEQLGKGAREIVLDVHFVRDTEWVGLGFVRQTDLYLCHSSIDRVLGCGPTDRKLGEALQDIKQFLESNSNEVIMLKLELFIDGKFSALFNKLDDRLGTFIFKPPTQIKTAGEDGVCQFLNQATVTKREIRALGKNVIVITDKCKKSKRKYSNTVFSGVIHADGVTTGTAEDHKFLKKNNVTDCNAASDTLHEKEMLRAVDGRTDLNLGSEEYHLLPSLIDEFLDCGLNIFEMFWYAADWTKSPEPHGPDEIRETLIWSWDVHFPVGTSTKAKLVRIADDINKFRNAPASETHDFACRKVGTSSSPAFNVWQVASTSPSRAFDQGEGTCLEETGGTHVFAVPRSKYELNALVGERSGEQDLWINYQEINNIWAPDIGTLVVSNPRTIPWKDTNNNGIHDDYEKATVDAGDDATNFSGEFHNVSASFIHPGDLRTHTATINWGDGGSTETVGLTQSGSSGTVTGSHQYFALREYTVEVCVTDEDGDTGCDSHIKTVKRLPVPIDDKPNSDPSSWPCEDRTKPIPVAILSTDAFDATTVDAATVRYGKDGTEAAEVHTKTDKDGSVNAKRHVEDVNKDNLTDMVFHFDSEATGLLAPCDQILPGESLNVDTVLTGETQGGTAFAGEGNLRLTKKNN